MPIPELYKKYHLAKDHTSLGLFRALNHNFQIENVFYPGSHVHITPSLIFPQVTYADSYKNTYKFFQAEATFAFINDNKEYSQPADFRFFQQDYNAPFEELGKEFDLLISQYAGFVGQAAKPYLKKGALLVCNNSHGDASLAALDSDYKLIAVYRRYADDKYTISSKKLAEYLIPKNGTNPNKAKILAKMQGIAYTKTPSGYIFAKITD